jgi:hypothetical protein
MKLTGENGSTRGKTCHSATLSTTNPTWTDLGSNQIHEFTAELNRRILSVTKTFVPYVCTLSKVSLIVSRKQMHRTLCVGSCHIIRIQYRITIYKAPNIITLTKKLESRLSAGCVSKISVQDFLCSAV